MQSEDQHPLLESPGIVRWIPYIKGGQYLREVYALFLYDGTILPAMFPSLSITTPTVVDWTYIGNVANGSVESYADLTEKGYYVIPHSSIVALRLMLDEELKQHGVVWDTGATRCKNMKGHFLHPTPARRYTIKEIRSLAKSIEYAVASCPRPNRVLNILKISLRDVIDK